MFLFVLDLLPPILQFPHCRTSPLPPRPRRPCTRRHAPDYDSVVCLHFGHRHFCHRRRADLSLAGQQSHPFTLSPSPPSRLAREYLSLSPWTRVFKSPRLAPSKAGNRAHFSLLFFIGRFVLALPFDDELSYCAVVHHPISRARALSPQILFLRPLRLPFAHSRTFGIAAFIYLFLPFELTSRLTPA